MSTAAAASSVFLFLYPGSTIQILCYLTALYALALSVGKVFLARYWKGTLLEQVVMYVLAGIAFVFSALLTMVAGGDQRNGLGVIGGYCLFVGLQMLLSMYYLQQHNAKTYRLET